MKSQEEIRLNQRVAQLEAEVRRLRGALEEIAEVDCGDLCFQLAYWAADALKPYRGDPNCSDCLTMTHCETHHKVEGLYPESNNIKHLLTQQNSEDSSLKTQAAEGGGSPGSSSSSGT